MNSMIAVVENHCVKNKLIVEKSEKIICLIKQTPKEAYYDRASLMDIADTTKKFNEEVLNSKKPFYEISFKEIKEDDQTIFELLCNDVLRGKNAIPTLNSIKEFTIWYKNHLSQNVKRDIEDASKMVEYMDTKRPL